MQCNNKDCFNLLECIAAQTEEDFGKTLGHDEAFEILDRMVDDSELSNLIDDAIAEHAQEKGWERRSY